MNYIKNKKLNPIFGVIWYAWLASSATAVLLAPAAVAIWSIGVIIGTR